MTQPSLPLSLPAHSPSPPTSPSLGASVSVRGDGAGGDSPTDLLFRDQQRFYQNMLVRLPREPPAGSMALFVIAVLYVTRLR